MRGLYVHVPFCVKKCSYCDFYSLAGRGESIKTCVDAILYESSAYSGMSFQTAYVGGGTPSLLGPSLLTSLISGLQRSFDLSGLVEATIEVNPDSASEELFEAAREVGINRVSIGVQSLNDEELKSAGRVHTAKQAIEAAMLAKQVGFRSVSADLIVGLPGQTWASLRKSLEAITGLGIEHLSLYCLSVEGDTPLAENPPDDLPSDDDQAELFERASELLSARGFVHYEISNFALQGHECLHNLNYWQGGEYVGLGPAAASHIQGRRFRNRADLDAYIQAPIAQAESIEYLGIQDKACEEAMLRLRLLSEGLDVVALAAKFGKDNVAYLISRLDSMVGAGTLDRDGSRYRLKPSRVLTSNPIFAEVLG